MTIVRRNFIILATFAAIAAATWLIWKAYPAEPAAAAASQSRLLIQENKPIEGWVVCKDLGVGPVPGLANPRQRVRLCHQAGWEVDTYCLRPDLPVPLVGGTCTRISEDTYNCGRGLQPLREYNIRETPTPSATNTPTPTPTSTLTPTTTPTSPFTPTNTIPPTQPQPTEIPSPTPVPTRRPSPGGPGFRQLLQQALQQLVQFPTPRASIEPTPTPFQPLHPTEIQPLAPTFPEIPVSPTSLPAVSPDPILPDQGQLQIRIKPDSQRLNAGDPIQIKVRIAEECEFGAGAACVNSYQDSNGHQITFITIHSGIGGEAQGLRHALEGTGFDQAGLTLSQVRKNLQALLGSAVNFSGRVDGEPYEVLAAVRLPANQVKDYISLPVSEALAFAAQVDTDLLAYISPQQSLVVIETCGWQMAGEPNRDGLPETSASVYLLVIGQTSPGQ